MFKKYKEEKRRKKILVDAYNSYLNKFYDICNHEFVMLQGSYEEIGEDAFTASIHINDLSGLYKYVGLKNKYISDEYNRETDRGSLVSVFSCYCPDEIQDHMIVEIIDKIFKISKCYFCKHQITSLTDKEKWILFHTIRNHFLRTLLCANI